MKNLSNAERFPHAKIGEFARIGEGVWIGKGGVIRQYAVIGNGVWIGEGVRIGEGAEIGKSAKIGKGVWIDAGMEIGEGAVIGEGARIVGSVATNQGIFRYHFHVDSQFGAPIPMFRYGCVTLPVAAWREHLDDLLEGNDPTCRKELEGILASLQNHQ